MSSKRTIGERKRKEKERQISNANLGIARYFQYINKWDYKDYFREDYAIGTLLRGVYSPVISIHYLSEHLLDEIALDIVTTKKVSITQPALPIKFTGYT